MYGRMRDSGSYGVLIWVTGPLTCTTGLAIYCFGMKYIRKRYPPQVRPPAEEDEDDLSEYDWVGMKRAAKRRPSLHEIWIDIRNKVTTEDVTVEVGRRGTKGGKDGLVISLVSPGLRPHNRYPTIS